ncbi:hypothetical protein RhiJN_03472 [Ceratobasidium sp. AG-Ba]|nr:hypothetical protein RhiJN_03472 [Ceratobasidium sp. AG-Ba]
MQQEVKFCIVCDSALGAATFVGLAMQLIQPMILRLQEKHPGCKLTAGMVTYTTPTTRPTIIVQRAFCPATAIFPLFKGAPHLLGIGTTGQGGPNGMAMLEGLVAAVEMCDDVLESQARKLRTRRPDAVQQPTRPPPIFHVLLIGNSRIDQARRPLCNRSSALDGTTWESLSEELSKRNINLSLCISTPTKDAKDQPVLALHSKARLLPFLWPSPDPVWFPQPKNYTLLLAGTHMPGAASKRPPEQASSASTSKRPKHESPKPAPRPPPGRIDIPAPTFPPAPTAPQTQPPAQPVQAPAPPPAAPAPPQPPSIPVPPPPPAPAAPAQPHTSPPPPTQPAIQQPPQANPPPPAQPNVMSAGQLTPQLIGLYRQIHMALRTPNMATDSRNKLLATGFRIDASGQLIGGAGVVFDAKGEPGFGATVVPKVHAMAFERARAAAAQAGIIGAGVGGVNPATAAMTQQALTIQMMRQQQLIQQQRAAQAQAGMSGQAGPSQPQLQAQAGQLQPPQQIPPVAQGSPPKSNPSPSLANQSPSHTHLQPSGQQVPGMLPGQGFPSQASQSTAGTPSQNNMGTPQHSGMTPQTQNMGTPQHAAQTPQAHVANTPQPYVPATPQQVVSTPQQPQNHGTPQRVTGTPQLVHAMPQQASPQNTNTTIQQNPNIGGQSGSNTNMSQNPNPSIPQNPTVGANSSGSQAPNPQSQNPNGQQTWKGQIAYLLRQRDDQSPAQLHFHAIAAGGPGHNIETDKWPPRLVNTTGFKALPRPTAAQLYASPLPFGQIIIDPVHSAPDQQKHAVFHKVITAGYSIFYEFPHNPMNPLPPNAQPGSARGLLFFSTPTAPARILFKVFLEQPCPPVLCRGGQPAGPGLMGNNMNGATAANGANGSGTGPSAVSGAGPALPGGGAGVGAPAMSAGAGSGSGNGLPGGGASAGLHGAGVGLGGLPNAANNMLGAQHSNLVPGAGLQGMVPGAGMIAGAGARPNPTPTPPNINPTPNPTMGINPAMMQNLNAGGIPGLGSAAVSGLGVGGVPGLAGAGLNPGNAPGLVQGNMPGLNAGNVPGMGAANVAGLNPAAMGVARQPHQQQQINALHNMALAKLGLTPAQYASAPPQQQQQITQRVQQLMLQVAQQRQQQQAAAAVANGMGVAGMGARPGMAPGQPGFEQLQAFMRQQQQRQSGQ